MVPQDISLIEHKEVGDERAAGFFLNFWFVAASLHTEGFNDEEV